MVSANYNRYISDIIVAIIIYFAGFSRLIIELLTKQQRKMTEKVNAQIAEAKAKETVIEPVAETLTEQQAQTPVEEEKGAKEE